MRFLYGVLALILIGLLGVLGAFLLWGRNLPDVADLDVLEFSGQTRVFDRNGQFVGTLTPSLSSGYRVNRDLRTLDKISDYTEKAVVTSEDRRFYEHSGVDLIGVTRGLVKGLLRNDLEGGSSITQQVVKNTLLAEYNQARTPERKFKEAVLAFQVERNFNKGEILNAYLNVIYWGTAGHGKGDIVGVANAARAYFGQDAATLNLAQSVYLATLIPAPNRRYPRLEEYRPLMRNLLDRMVEDGRVTKAEADAAWRYPLTPAGWRTRYDASGKLLSATLVNEGARAANLPRAQTQVAESFLGALERDLIQKVGRKALFSSGGVRVDATLDLAAQRAAEAASRNARVPGGATLGIALTDPASGDILALVGQKYGDGIDEEWNNATQARRQVGSSIKPLLYTTALEKGWKQSDTALDAPLTGEYQPKNYSGTSSGRQVTLRYALDHSLNLPTVRLAQDVGLNDFAGKLRTLGLSPNDNAGLPLAIGALEASPLQMAAAYAPFANGGTYHEPRYVHKVTKGTQVLYTAPDTSTRAWDEQTAFLGLDMIRGVVNDLTPRQGGLGWRARIPGWDVGGKTGTTNDVKDLWFVGVTPRVSAAVWVGRSDSKAMPQNAYSGDIAAPIWQSAVSGALANKPHAAFKAPSGIEYRWVRGVNMAFKSEGGGGIGGWFRRTPAPPAPDPTPAQPEPEQPTDAPAEPEPAPDVTEPQPEEQTPAPEELPQPEDLQPTPPDTSTSTPTPATPTPAPEQPTAPPVDEVPVPEDVQPLPDDPTAEPTPAPETPTDDFGDGTAPDGTTPDGTVPDGSVPDSALPDGAALPDAP
ncbi:transglycosylase domain-containing protein [Deinococcus maricopensis]|uniref:peptidoglycan glycosyltransferase n=1 Tax=Deinococcus maricopensis (strain DSM 21211 / LMG 22137 / NRRL B-23946 / LB-34) TaxID=709986 RepID=E8U6G7_DEIML|nr:transglycosylase domain-containing protein [Deinococcus maricopensis]ADV66656.1 glycosyl transferase family 51 [Deinococcus maricopensis DSM 21211]